MHHELIALKPDFPEMDRNVCDDIWEMINAIIPLDTLEQCHIQETLDWIISGVPIFRLQKPAIPPMHLCVYFVLIDPDYQKILLVHHNKAEKWLPAGGHVDLNEHPALTVTRECFEELAVTADFIRPDPLFCSITTTVGQDAGHVDVSLWYGLRGSVHQSFTFDVMEMNQLKWFSSNDLPYENCDPHLKRFIQKLVQQNILKN